MLKGKRFLQNDCREDAHGQACSSGQKHKNRRRIGACSETVNEGKY
jgi:hypothetical protein